MATIPIHQLVNNFKSIAYIPAVTSKENNPKMIPKVIPFFLIISFMIFLVLRLRNKYSNSAIIYS
jgi:large-conductance mechanosensitive channel